MLYNFDIHQLFFKSWYDLRLDKDSRNEPDQDLDKNFSYTNLRNLWATFVCILLWAESLILIKGTEKTWAEF